MRHDDDDNLKGLWVVVTHPHHLALKFYRDDITISQYDDIIAPFVSFFISAISHLFRIHTYHPH